jgi:hypothetical protein
MQDAGSRDVIVRMSAGVGRAGQERQEKTQEDDRSTKQRKWSCSVLLISPPANERNLLVALLPPAGASLFDPRSPACGQEGKV